MRSPAVEAGLVHHKHINAHARSTPNYMTVFFGKTSLSYTYLTGFASSSHASRLARFWFTALSLFSCGSCSCSRDIIFLFSRSLRARQRLLLLLLLLLSCAVDIQQDARLKDSSRARTNKRHSSRTRENISSDREIVLLDQYLLWCFLVRVTDPTRSILRHRDYPIFGTLRESFSAS